MKLVKRISIWIDVLKCFILTLRGVKANILSSNETVEKIISGKSLIRFGDGEFGIYRNKDIHYQSWSPELKKCFDDIKSKFERMGEDCPYLLAVPKHFMTVKGTQLMKKRVYVSSWSQSRYDFKRNFGCSLTYGDAFLFEKSNKDIYSKIWLDESCPANIIFLHNNEQYAEYFANTYEKNTVFVKCPAKDSFAELESLENEIRSVIAENCWSHDQVLITISSGPAGKILCYKLSMDGYRCVDAGHCWDDPLEDII